MNGRDDGDGCGPDYADDDDNDGGGGGGDDDHGVRVFAVDVDASVVDDVDVLMSVQLGRVAAFQS